MFLCEWVCMCVRVCVSACDRPSVRDRLCEWFGSLCVCVQGFVRACVCLSMFVC